MKYKVIMKTHFISNSFLEQVRKSDSLLNIFNNGLSVNKIYNLALEMEKNEKYYRSRFRYDFTVNIEASSMKEIRENIINNKNYGNYLWTNRGAFHYKYKNIGSKFLTARIQYKYSTNKQLKLINFLVSKQLIKELEDVTPIMLLFVMSSPSSYSGDITTLLTYEIYPLISKRWYKNKLKNNSMNNSKGFNEV